MRTNVAVVLSIGLFASALGACGGTDSDVPEGVVDIRVPIPAADPNYLDLVSPEIVIEPGEEKMYCYYLTNDEALAVSTMEALQGQYGHHIVLLTTIEPQPTGTLEDCTDQSTMWKFRSFVLPLDLPQGYGIRVPENLQYVMQLHYVNAGEEPLLIRDVARLRKIDESAVQRWVATLTTNSLRFEIPPGPGKETFDCTLAEDLDLLILGGHMHESGTRYTIEVGPSVENLKNLYLVDPWKPVYRDAPPMSLFLENPHRVTAGTVVRTTCEWNNSTSSTIGFPGEMCASFGYLAGTDKPFHCEPPKAE
jgi:hypothetical protein